MKVSQKLLAVLLSLAMLFSLAGCGLDSIVSDSPTSISDTSTDSESQITDGSSETDKQTEIADEGSESNKQEETTSPSSKPSSVGSGSATPVKPASGRAERKSRIRCSECGSFFRRKVRSGGVKWVCAKHEESTKSCNSTTTARNESMTVSYQW